MCCFHYYYYFATSRYTNWLRTLYPSEIDELLISNAEGRVRYNGPEVVQWDTYKEIRFNTIPMRKTYPLPSPQTHTLTKLCPKSPLADTSLGDISPAFVVTRFPALRL